jgi:AAA domain
LKMTSSTEMRGRQGTTWLVYGTYGVGKTPFATCFPQPWLWDCEAGSASAVVELPVTKVETYMDILTLIQQAQQRSPQGEVSLMGQKFPVKTIIVDTVGEMSRIIINSQKGSKEIATLPDWGAMVERMRNITRHLRDMRDMGLNIVFIAHEQYLKQNETELVLGMPDLPGKELPTDLPKLCDFVVRMRVRRNAAGKLERIINTAPDGQFICRDRFGRLAETEVIPDFGDLKGVRGLLAKAGVNFEQGESSNG